MEHDTESGPGAETPDDAGQIAESAPDATAAPAWRWTSPVLWLATFAIVVWGLYPFRIIVHHYPWKVDAIKWVSQGSLDNPTWFRWVFRSHHFVGYRPVAAGSFVVNHATSGYAPEGYRITDFLLHGLSAVAIALLATRLLGRKSLWALVPVLLYIGHPAIEEALPYLARRSYLLATMFGTFGLTVWLDSLEQPKLLTGRSWAATGLIGLALLSNEAAYVLLPLVPLLAWSRRGSLGEALKRSIVVWLPAIPAVITRFVVLGWTGGYTKHYFAYTRNGVKTLRETFTFNAHEIFGAAYDYLWFPVSFKGADTITDTPVLIFAIASFYFWAVVAEPLIEGRDHRRRTPLLLAVWFLGYAMLFSLSRTWFWRQGYPMVTPLALLVGWVLADTVTRFRRQPVQLAGRLLPQLALIVGLLWHSPLVRGMTPGPIQGRFDGNESVHGVSDLVDDLEGPARIYTVFPLNKGSHRNALTWLARLHGKQKLDFQTLAFGTPRDGLATTQGAKLTIGPQGQIPKGVLRAKRIEGRVIDLPSLRDGARPTYVALPQPRGGWSLVPVDSPGRPAGSRGRGE